MDEVRTIDALVARIEELERRLAASTGGAPDAPRPSGTDERTGASRRGLLLGAAALGAGAVASLASVEPAAADDPNDLTLGASKSASGLTEGRYTGGSGGAAFLFQRGSTFSGAVSAYGCALAGWTSDAGNATGVYAYSSVANGNGVVGTCPGGFGVVGISSTSTGVVGASTDGTAVGGTSTNDVGVYGQGGTYGVDALGGVGGIRARGTTGKGVVAVALDGYTLSHGVHGAGTTGVLGDGAVTGVRGNGDFAGVWGQSTDGSAVVAISSHGFGVSATSSDSMGVNAAGGTYGVQGFGPTAGVYGVSLVGRALDGAGVDGCSVDAADYGFRNRTAGKAVLHLSPVIRGGGERLAPAARTDAHLRGEVDIDTNGDLWLCTAAGTPGTWRKLSGPAAAGAFHAVTPGRVYDSRVPDPGPIAPLVAGQERTIDVAGRRQLTTGTVELADFVPAGATAIAANVTVVDTVSAGFLTANPGGVHAVGAATVNWSATGQILNNGVILTVDANRRLNVIAGGSPGASTHFVVDVTGYFL